MAKTELPFWLYNTIIVGREGDENEGDDEGNNSDDDGEEAEEEEDDDTGSGGNSSDDDVEALKKALREERKFRRKAERDARRATKQKTDEAEEKDLKAAQKRAEESEQRTQKIAARLLRNEVDSAIREEARRQGFIDPTDALTDDIRAAIDADQDEDDPSDIDIDPDSVATAVKKLAQKKKHLLGQPNGGEPSGSKHRRKQGGQESTDEAGLQKLYPSLS